MCGILIDLRYLRALPTICLHPELDERTLDIVHSLKRFYRKLTFDNVLARWGSSFCHRARLNFQAFSLRELK